MDVLLEIPGIKEIIRVFKAIYIDSRISLITSIVMGLIDGYIYLLHDCMLKPLIQELVSTFSMNKEMFHESSNDMMSLMLTYCHEKIQVVGFAILLLIAMWQVFKTFFAYAGLTEAEESWKISAKLIIYGFLVLYSKDICEIAIDMALKAIDVLGGVDTGAKSTEYDIIVLNLPASSNIGSNIKEIIKNVLERIGKFPIEASNPFAPVIKGLMIAMVDIKLLNVSLDMTEKYMNLVFMILISPIAFACGVAKSTNKLLNKWVTFFMSNILYQVFQFVLLGMLYYITVKMNNDNTIKILLLMFSLVSLMTSLNDLIDELGFAQLGKSASAILRTISGINSMAGSVAESAGRIKKKEDMRKQNNKEGGNNGNLAGTSASVTNQLGSNPSADISIGINN